MPSLQVRELPDDVYAKLVEAAEKQHRSIAQQAVVVLAQALHLETNNKARRKAVFADLQANPLLAPQQRNRLKDPVIFIREDRKR